MSDIDPVLLAVSDTLVFKALERAATYGPRARRRGGAAGRYRAYEDNPVPVERIDSVVGGMFTLCPLLADRHNLDVDVVAWAALLESYTRVLLMMGQTHRPAHLIDTLGQLPDRRGDDWDE